MKTRSFLILKPTNSLTKPFRIVFDYLIDGADLHSIKESISKNKDVQYLLGDQLCSKIFEANQSAENVTAMIADHLIQTNSTKDYQYYRVYTVLYRLTINNADFIPALYKSYDLYADGYYFMETIGVQHGLSFSNIYFDFFQWDKLSDNDKRVSLEKIFPSVQAEAKKILLSLDKEKIKITGKKDKEGVYTFIDNRSDFERLSVFDNMPTKPRKSKWPVLFKLAKRKVWSSQLRKK